MGTPIPTHHACRTPDADSSPAAAAEADTSFDHPDIPLNDIPIDGDMNINDRPQLASSSDHSDTGPLSLSSLRLVGYLLCYNTSDNHLQAFQLIVGQVTTRYA